MPFRYLLFLIKGILYLSARSVVRQESAHSTEGEAATEESSAAAQMEEIFQRLMKLTGESFLFNFKFLSVNIYNFLLRSLGFHDT